MFAAKVLTEEQKRSDMLNVIEGQLDWNKNEDGGAAYVTAIRLIYQSRFDLEKITKLIEHNKKLKQEIWEMREKGVKPKAVEPVKEVTASDVYPEKKKTNTMSDRYVGD